MYENIASSYPESFFFNLSKLSGSMSKSLIKCSADRVTAQPGNITNIRLPIGSVLNLDSLALWFKVTTSGAATVPVRYSSSFIKRMSISMNNTTVQIIEDYNLLYNIYQDHKNKALTKGIGGEMLDNSIKWSEVAGAADQTKIVGASSMLASTAGLTDEQMCVNNWLGFFGSSSTRIVSSDKTGEIVVSCSWASPAEVLAYTGEASAVTASASDTYTIDDIYMTVESLSFSDDSYYNAISNKDLVYSYSDYVVTKFADAEKKSGMNVTTYISSGSIDHIFGTCINTQQSLPSPLVAYGSLGTGASEAVCANMYSYLADPVAKTDNSSATVADNIYGDGFFSSLAMQRNMQHLDTSVFSINNKQLNYAPLNKFEVFQNNLCALGYEGVDSSANGLNPACVSIYHYYKYFGVAMQSLELIDRDAHYISGLSSQGSSCSITWSAKFLGASNTYTVTPLICAKLTKLLHVKAGRSIQVE